MGDYWDDRAEELKKAGTAPAFGASISDYWDDRASDGITPSEFAARSQKAGLSVGRTEDEHARLLREQGFAGGDLTALMNQYRLGAAKESLRGTSPGGALEQFHRTAVPFGDAWDAKGDVAYQEAVKRFQSGDASPEVVGRIARYERLAERDEEVQSTFGGKLLQAGQGVLKLVGEGWAAGKVVGLAGRAVPGKVGRAMTGESAGLASQLAKTGAMMPLMPSMYLGEMRSRNLEAGRDVNDLRGLPGPYLFGWANLMVLNRLQSRVMGAPKARPSEEAWARMTRAERNAARTTLAERLGPAGTIAGSGVLGAVEMQVVEAAGGLWDEVASEVLQTRTKYGPLGMLARGEAGEALQHFAVTAFTFSLFSGLHYTPPGEAGLEATRRVRQARDRFNADVARGLSARAAADRETARLEEEAAAEVNKKEAGLYLQAEGTPVVTRGGELPPGLAERAPEPEPPASPAAGLGLAEATGRPVVTRGQADLGLSRPTPPAEPPAPPPTTPPAPPARPADRFQHLLPGWEKIARQALAEGKDPVAVLVERGVGEDVARDVASRVADRPPEEGGTTGTVGTVEAKPQLPDTPPGPPGSPVAADPGKVPPGTPGGEVAPPANAPEAGRPTARQLLADRVEAARSRQTPAAEERLGRAFDEAGLKPSERAVMIDYAAGKTQAQIASERGVTPARVGQIAKDALAKLGSKDTPVEFFRKFLKADAGGRAKAEEVDLERDPDTGKKVEKSRRPSEGIMAARKMFAKIERLAGEYGPEPTEAQKKELDALRKKAERFLSERPPALNDRIDRLTEELASGKPAPGRAAAIKAELESLLAMARKTGADEFLATKAGGPGGESAVLSRYESSKGRVKEHLESALYRAGLVDEAGRRAEPDEDVSPATVRQRLASGLASEYRDAAPPDRAALAESLADVGATPIGSEGQSVGLDGSIHEAPPGKFTGAPVRVLRRGWMLGDRVLLKARTAADDGPQATKGEGTPPPSGGRSATRDVEAKPQQLPPAADPRLKGLEDAAVAHPGMSPELVATSKAAFREAFARLPDGVKTRVAENVDGTNYYADAPTLGRQLLSDVIAHRRAELERLRSVEDPSPEEVGRARYVTEKLAEAVAELREVVAGKKPGRYVAAWFDGKLYLDGPAANPYGGRHGTQGPARQYDVFLHEVGHGTDRGGRYSSTPEWEGIFYREIDRPVVTPGSVLRGLLRGEEAHGRLSNYARTSPQEGFAEFFRVVHSADAAKLKQLEKEFPAASRFFKDHGLWPETPGRLREPGEVFDDRVELGGGDHLDVGVRPTEAGGIDPVVGLGRPKFHEVIATVGDVWIRKWARERGMEAPPNEDPAALLKRIDRSDRADEFYEFVKAKDREGAVEDFLFSATDAASRRGAGLDAVNQLYRVLGEKFRTGEWADLSPGEVREMHRALGAKTADPKALAGGEPAPARLATGDAPVDRSSRQWKELYDGFRAKEYSEAEAREMADDVARSSAEVEAEFQAELSEGKSDVARALGRGKLPELPGGRSATGDDLPLATKVTDISDLHSRGENLKRVVGAWWRKHFHRAGDAPESAFDVLLENDRTVAAQALAVSQAVKSYGDVVGPFWKQPPEQVKLHDAALRDPEVMKTLPLEERVPLTRFRDEMDLFSDKLMAAGVISERLVPGVTANKGVYLTRHYQAHTDPGWGGRDGKLYREHPEVVTAFKNWYNAEARRIGRDVLTDAELDNYVESLLHNMSPAENPVHVFTRAGLGKDLGILMPRGDLAAPLRELMGEVRHPVANYAATTGRQVQLLANHVMQVKLRDVGLSEGWLARPDDYSKPGLTATLAPRESGVMDVLAGFRTTPEVKAALEAHYSKAENSKLMRHYMKTLGLFKYGKTVLSPVAHLRQILGNPFFVMRNGYGFSKEATDALVSVWKGTPEGRLEHQKWVRFGLDENSVFGREFGDVMKEALKSKDLFDFTERLGGRSATGVARDLLKLPQKAYRYEDLVPKIYGFYGEQARIREAHPEWGAEQVEAEAARRVLAFYPSYSQLSAFVQNLRRFPLVGPFVSFTAEVIRTTYNTAAQARKELTSDNAAERRHGAARLRGLAGSLVAFAAVGAVSRVLAGVSLEEEDAIRRHMPPWSADGQLLHLGKGPDGKYRVIDLGRTDPHTFLWEPVQAALTGRRSGTYTLADSLVPIANPFVQEELGTRVALDIARNRVETGGSAGRTVYNPEDSRLRQSADVVMHFIRGIEPGLATQIVRTGSAASGIRNPTTGKEYTLSDELLADFTGQRIIGVDPAESLTFKARTYTGRMSDAARGLTAEVGRLNRAGLAPSAESIAPSYERAQEMREKVFDDLLEDVRAARLMGATQADVAKALKAGGLSAEDVGMVLGGKFRPRPAAEYLKRR